MDRIAWLALDANLFLKLTGLAFLSSHRLCDGHHAPAMLCEQPSSNYLPRIKLLHPTPTLMGNAAQHSRTFWKTSPRYVRSILFSSLSKPDYHCLELNGRGLHSSLDSLSAFWTCGSLWRIHQTYSYKEISFMQTYDDLGNQTPFVASFLEHFFKSSYASFARAIYVWSGIFWSTSSSLSSYRYQKIFQPL